MWFSTSVRETAKARRICGACPVSAACLEDALTASGVEQYGVRAGTTGEQRKAMLRRSRHR